jgi:hypothetical protein
MRCSAKVRSSALDRPGGERVLEGFRRSGPLLQRLERDAQAQPGVRDRRLHGEPGAVSLRGFRVAAEPLQDRAAQDMELGMVRRRGGGCVERVQRADRIAALDVDARERDGEIGLRHVEREPVLQELARRFELAALESERDERLPRRLVPRLDLDRQVESGLGIGRAARA